jgi:DNA polymerase V
MLTTLNITLTNDYQLSTNCYVIGYNQAMKTKVEIIYSPDTTTKCNQPLFDAKVPAGFPSPAADYEEDKLDLNRHLIKNPAATFFVKVTGDSMEGAGIHHGDLLVVDRSIEPHDKNIVIAVINGELTVKRIRIRSRKITLQPENKNYRDQEIAEDAEFEVWGVVTNVIHQL